MELIGQNLKKDKKMEKEFNLSEKINNYMNVTPKGLVEDVISINDIKEFIKRLKLNMNLSWYNTQVINNLAGDKFR